MLKTCAIFSVVIGLFGLGKEKEPMLNSAPPMLFILPPPLLVLLERAGAFMALCIMFTNEVTPAFLSGVEELEEEASDMSSSRIMAGVNGKFG